MISNRKEIFDKLVDERFERITELEKNVYPDKLIYIYKGLTADKKFDELDNALNLLDKIQEGEINLAKAKSDQITLKPNLGKKNKNKTKIKDKSKE